MVRVSWAVYSCEPSHVTCWLNSRYICFVLGIMSSKKALDCASKSKQLCFSQIYILILTTERGSTTSRPHVHLL